MSTWGYAGCPVCLEPLITTLERPKSEFKCQVCGRYYGFFDPRGIGDTPEIAARHAELKAAFDAERAGQ